MFSLLGHSYLLIATTKQNFVVVQEQGSESSDVTMHEDKIRFFFFLKEQNYIHSVVSTFSKVALFPGSPGRESLGTRLPLRVNMQKYCQY